MNALRTAQGSWLQTLHDLESLHLLSTAGHLAFDLSGLSAGVRDVRLTATELQGSVCAEHQLQTLQLKSGRALDITVVPSRAVDGAHHIGGEPQVLPAVSLRNMAQLDGSLTARSFRPCFFQSPCMSQDRLEIVTTASQLVFTADVPPFPWPATGYDPDLEAVEALAALLRCLRASSIAFTAPAVSFKARIIESCLLQSMETSQELSAVAVQQRNPVKRT